MRIHLSVLQLSSSLVHMLMPVSRKRKPKTTNKRKHAFTLIEVMIALLIFAIMAVITSVGLATVLKARERASENSQRLSAAQLAITIMTRDFTQMINRPISDSQGSLAPPIIANNGYIEFTRAGYVNPDMVLPRSTLQRVAYRVSNDQLVRISWPVLDRAPDTKPESRILLNNVSNFQIRYLDYKNQFNNSWPPTQSTAQTQTAQSPLPKAVEITIAIKNWGTIQRLYMVPSG